MPKTTASPNGGLYDDKTECPILHVFRRIGGKWKLLVIYFLSLQKVIRFGQLRRTLPEISERMLVRQLRELEDDGLVSRTVYGTVPPRVDYALTPLGESLVPIMESLKAWGSMYEKSRYQTEFGSGA